MAAPSYNPQMKAFMVVDRVTLPEVPSASGLAEVPEGWLVACDDLPELFALDHGGKTLARFQIGAPPPLMVEGRVPKKHKRDFEAIASWRKGRETELLVFGSGSKFPQRSFIVHVRWQGTVIQQAELACTPFYAQVMQQGRFPIEQLNIEGATVFDDRLILLNRGTNELISMDLNAAMAYLQGGCKGSCPQMTFHGHALPEISGVQVGFSGACSDVRRNRVYFCASAEDTPDWIQDGAVLGSYVGWIVRPTAASGGELYAMPVVDAAGNHTPDKIEAITLLPPVDGKVRVLAFTDTDGGPSDMLTLELT